MESQLVISTEAVKYGHVSSLGIKQVFSSSLQPLGIIFHPPIMPLFLLPACRHVLPRACYAVGRWSTRPRLLSSQSSQSAQRHTTRFVISTLQTADRGQNA